MLPLLHCTVGKPVQEPRLTLALVLWPLFKAAVRVAVQLPHAAVAPIEQTPPAEQVCAAERAPPRLQLATAVPVQAPLAAMAPLLDP